MPKTAINLKSHTKDTISYFDNEKGNPTLVFIHGSFINKEYFERQISYFSPNYRVIALDLAGHGNSTRDGDDWTTKRFGTDVSELIEKLSLKNVILIGHSLGGDIMLEAVHNNPASIIGIIAIDYFKNINFKLPKEIINQIISNLQTDFASTSEQYVKEMLITGDTEDEIARKVSHDYRNMDPEIGIAMTNDLLNCPERKMELLKGLRHKLYLINVDYFPTNENELEKILGDNYELMSLEGTCHYPMLENPDRLNELLEKTILKIEQEH